MAQDLWENRDQALAALETGGIGAASALTVGGVTYGLLTRKRRELMREWVFPLHEALALPLRVPEQTDPRRYLHIPKNFSDDAAEIRVDVPGRLDFSKDLIADLITQKLALEGVTFSWHVAGRETYVMVKKTRKPPAKALLKDPKIREMMAKAKESAPVIGVGSGGKAVSVDLDADSPHVVISAGTGGGKSTILRTVTCQSGVTFLILPRQRALLGIVLRRGFGARGGRRRSAEFAEEPPVGAAESSGPDGEVGLPSVEESFESQLETALSAVGRVGKFGITNDPGEEWMAPGLDDFVEVGRVGVHPFLVADSGASDGFLLGEFADGVAADEGMQRFDDGDHDVDVEAEGIEGGECVFGGIEGVRSK